MPAWKVKKAAVPSREVTCAPVPHLSSLKLSGGIMRMRTIVQKAMTAVSIQ